MSETGFPLRINPESTQAGDHPSTDAFEYQIASAKQIQQLASRLKQNELELEQRTKQLDQEILAWNNTVTDQEALYQTKLSQLEQQASQVRCQQLNLMQLQTDIVNSYEATRRAIENLFVEDSNAGTSLAALEAIRLELNGRFNFISRRWEHLAELLHGPRPNRSA